MDKEDRAVIEEASIRIAEAVHQLREELKDLRLVAEGILNEFAKANESLESIRMNTNI